MGCMFACKSFKVAHNSFKLKHTVYYNFYRCFFLNCRGYYYFFPKGINSFKSVLLPLLFILFLLLHTCTCIGKFAFFMSIHTFICFLNLMLEADSHFLVFEPTAESVQEVAPVVIQSWSPPQLQILFEHCNYIDITQTHHSLHLFHQSVSFINTSPYL